MRILLAVDGSDTAARAARHAIALVKALRSTADLHVLYANTVMAGVTAIDLGPEALARYLERDARYALRRVRSQLKRAGIAYKEHHVVGDPAESIIRFLESRRCDLAIMGSRGHSALKNAFLGSVAAKVLANCTTPLTVVR